MKKNERDILSKTLWFNKRNHYEIDYFDLLLPRRTVSEHPRYKSGVFYSEKCKREIQYESGIELDFIKQLEKLEKVTFYFEQPIQIQFRKAKKKMVYTPDFGIYLNTKEFVLVEIKDLPGMLDDYVQMKIEVLLEYCCEKGFGLLLTDGKNTFEKLLNTKGVNPDFENEILFSVNDNALRKKECEAIMKKYGSTQNDLFKIIVKHHLKYKPFPFKLQHGNINHLFRKVFIEKKSYDEVRYTDYPPRKLGYHL